MRITEKTRARSWRAATWAGLAVGVFLAAAGGWAAYQRWPIPVGGGALCALWAALGFYVGRRPQAARLAALVEAYRASMATSADLAEVGRVTDRAAAEMHIGGALLYAWGVATESTPQDEADAAQTAALVLVALDDQGCRVLVPRDDGVPAATEIGDDLDPPANLFPGEAPPPRTKDEPPPVPPPPPDHVAAWRWADELAGRWQ